MWLIVIAAVILALAVAAYWISRAMSADVQRATGNGGGSLYDLETHSLEGEPVNLNQYRGQVVLVVNTASKCGLTPQYEGLEALYRELSPRGFVILGFPSNDFLRQEPGLPGEIRRFCADVYAVSFPLFEKSRVKGGDKSAIYRLLTAELAEPSWNFTKYVVDREGRVVARFGPRTSPDSPRLRETIERALATN